MIVSICFGIIVFVFVFGVNQRLAAFFDQDFIRAAKSSVLTTDNNNNNNNINNNNYYINNNNNALG